jgi:hypothetical protein
MDTLLMAQQLQNITINAPAFAGINSQDSPISLDQSFAATASNCVIDSYGRIGARKGYTEVSTDSSTATQLGSSRGIEAVHEYVKNDGTKIVFSAGNNKIFTGTTTLTPVTLPALYSITANNWKIVTFNNNVVFFQKGHHPLASIAGNTTLIKIEDGGHDAPFGNEVIAAYGRLWSTGVEDELTKIYWSSLLVYDDWHGSGAGSLDLSNVFPTGNDEVVALAAHNGFLIIFGRRSIIVYEGAEFPNAASVTFKLADTVEGVGCISRDSVQHTGTDIIFLSEDGVRSFSRTIQEKSMPMRDLSKNVRTELTQEVRLQSNPIKSLYSADEAFYLLSLPDSQTIYCFDMRTSLPDGSNRVTTWSTVEPHSMTVLQDGSIYFGRKNGIFKYEGYADDGSEYLLLYYSNPLNFGNSANLKFLKKFNITIIGSVEAHTTLVWGYDYTNNFNKKIFSSSKLNSSAALFNTSEYGDNTTTLVTPSSTGTYLGAFSSAPTTNETNALYYNTTDNKLYYWNSTAWIEETTVDSSYVAATYTVGTDIQRPRINTNGSGAVVTIGIESTINGSPYSIQQIDIHALLGRLI